MKKIAYLLLGLIATVSMTGCSTAPAYDKSVTEMAQYFYNQQRVYKSLEITGASEFVVRGSNLTFALSNELQPLSIIPKDPGIATTLINSAERCLTMGLGIYTAGTVMNKLSERPTVVQQQVVRPEVIQVGQ